MLHHPFKLLGKTILLSLTKMDIHDPITFLL